MYQPPAYRPGPISSQIAELYNMFFTQAVVLAAYDPGPQSPPEPQANNAGQSRSPVLHH